MNLSGPLRTSLLSAVLLAAACGGTVNVDPIGNAPGEPDPAKTDPGGNTTTPGGPGNTTPPVKPQPTGPYDGLVATTDVSILYPMPSATASRDFVKPTETGNHGVLFPESAFTAVFGNRRGLELTSNEFPSDYSTFALVSIRLDPCAARGAAGSCTSEVRLVFQAIYDKPAGRFDDPVAGPAAHDGAVHVMYDVPEAELVTMTKQILTLKKANGGLGLQELAPHPILAQQGLGGAFAAGLRSIVLEHLGDARIGRVTFFDHNFAPDSDGWEFGVFDRAGAGYVAKNIPVANRTSQMVAGTDALVPLAQSGIFDSFLGNTVDGVSTIVDQNRPQPGTPSAAPLTFAYDAALKVQNPAKHTAESMDCANCHLAEGAALIGKSTYAFTSTTNAFSHTRSLAYVSERTSVTNLHAFGYLHRKVAIMQRTANESVLVAEAMEKKVK